MSRPDTPLGQVAWVVALLSLLLGPVVAVVGIALALGSRRGGGDWQPTVALGALVLCAWVALASLAISMS